MKRVSNEGAYLLRLKRSAKFFSELDRLLSARQKGMSSVSMSPDLERALRRFAREASMQEIKFLHEIINDLALSLNSIDKSAIKSTADTQR